MQRPLVKQQAEYDATLKIAAKFRKHLIGSLIKLNHISEVLMHGRFFENFMKSWKISLVTYRNM